MMWIPIYGTNFMMNNRYYREAVAVAVAEATTIICHHPAKCITATIGIKIVETLTCQIYNPWESIRMDRMDHQIKVNHLQFIQSFGCT